MNKLSFALLLLASQNAFAHSNCKLTVLSTETIAGGLQWNYLNYDASNLEECDDLCKDQEALKKELTPNDIPVNCKMKFTQEDGTVIKAKYRFIQRSLISLRLTSDRHCRPF